MWNLARFTAAALLVRHAVAAPEGWLFTQGDVFKQRLADQEHMIVASEWIKVREQFPSATALNCTDVPKVCEEADVSSIPTIRLYQADGEMSRYRGPRKASLIASFVERMARPVVTELSSEGLASFYKSDDIVVVAHLSGQDEGLLDHFLDVAENYRDRYTFGFIETSPESPSSRFVCRNNIDQLDHNSNDLNRVGALEELLEKCALPLILPLTRRNERAFNKIAKWPVYYFSDDEADREAYTARMRPVAKAFSQLLAFATVDSNEYPQMPQAFGLSTTRGLCLQNIHNGNIYHFGEGELSAEALQDFIMAISKGKVEPWNRDGTNNKHDEL